MGRTTLGIGGGFIQPAGIKATFSPHGDCLEAEVNINADVATVDSSAWVDVQILGQKVFSGFTVQGSKSEGFCAVRVAGTVEALKRLPVLADVVPQGTLRAQATVIAQSVTAQEGSVTVDVTGLSDTVTAPQFAPNREPISDALARIASLSDKLMVADKDRVVRFVRRAGTIDGDACEKFTEESPGAEDVVTAVDLVNSKNVRMVYRHRPDTSTRLSVEQVVFNPDTVRLLDKVAGVHTFERPTGSGDPFGASLPGNLGSLPAVLVSLTHPSGVQAWMTGADWTTYPTMEYSLPLDDVVPPTAEVGQWTVTSRFSFPAVDTLTAITSRIGMRAFGGNGMSSDVSGFQFNRRLMVSVNGGAPQYVGNESSGVGGSPRAFSTPTAALTLNTPAGSLGTEAPNTTYIMEMDFLFPKDRPPNLSMVVYFNTFHGLSFNRTRAAQYAGFWMNPAPRLAGEFLFDGILQPEPFITYKGSTYDVVSVVYYDTWERPGKTGVKIGNRVPPEQAAYRWLIQQADNQVALKAVTSNG